MKSKTEPHALKFADRADNDKFGKKGVKFLSLGHCATLMAPSPNHP